MSASVELATLLVILCCLKGITALLSEDSEEKSKSLNAGEVPLNTTDLELQHNTPPETRFNFDDAHTFLHQKLEDLMREPHLEDMYTGLPFIALHPNNENLSIPKIIPDNAYTDYMIDFNDDSLIPPVQGATDKPWDPHKIFEENLAKLQLREHNHDKHFPMPPTHDDGPSIIHTFKDFLSSLFEEELPPTNFHKNVYLIGSYKNLCKDKTFDAAIVPLNPSLQELLQSERRGGRRSFSERKHRRGHRSRRRRKRRRRRRSRRRRKRRGGRKSRRRRKRRRRGHRSSRRSGDVEDAAEENEAVQEAVEAAKQEHEEAVAVTEEAVEDALETERIIEDAQDAAGFGDDAPVSRRAVENTAKNIHSLYKSTKKSFEDVTNARMYDQRTPSSTKTASASPSGSVSPAGFKNQSGFAPDIAVAPEARFPKLPRKRRGRRRRRRGKFRRHRGKSRRRRGRFGRRRQRQRLKRRSGSAQAAVSKAIKEHNEAVVVANAAIVEVDEAKEAVREANEEAAAAESTEEEEVAQEDLAAAKEKQNKAIVAAEEAIEDAVETTEKVKDAAEDAGLEVGAAGTRRSFLSFLALNGQNIYNLATNFPTNDVIEAAKSIQNAFTGK